MQPLGHRRCKPSPLRLASPTPWHFPTLKKCRSRGYLLAGGVRSELLHSIVHAKTPYMANV